MKMKRRRRSMGALAAGVAGFSVVLFITLALNIFGGQARSQEQGSRVLPTAAPLTPTPEVPSIPAPEASIASAVLASPMFQNDAALSQWEFVDVGVRLPENRSVWRVQDGALLQNKTAAAANPDMYETMAFTGSPKWTDYTVSARFYDQGNGNVGLVARRQGDSFYRLQLMTSRFAETPQLILEKVVKGEASPLATLDGAAYEYHTWNSMALSVKSDQIQAIVNGKVVLSASDQTLTSGQPGLYTRALGQVRFANVLVTE
jgi:Domain of Unknown Function (DUF1080)